MLNVLNLISYQANELKGRYYEKVRAILLVTISIFLNIPLSGMWCSAYAARFSGLTIFGDSLSSDFGAWVENGEIYTQFLKQEYLSSEEAYSNYAVRADTSREIRDTIELFVQSPLRLSSNDLVILWGGINDYSVDTNYVIDGVNDLIGAGASNVLVVNLHDAPARDGNTIGQFNSNLLTGLNVVEGNVIQIDLYTLYRKLASAPELFAYPTDPALHGVTKGDPVLTDDLHFTSYTQRIFADHIISIMDAPGLISAMPEVSLSASRAFFDRMKQRSIQLLASPEKRKWIPFIEIGAGASTYENAESTFPGFDVDRVDFSAGFSFRITGNCSIGMVVNRSYSDGEFDDDRGEFEMDQTVFSIESGYRWRRFFADARLAYLDIDYDTIRRNFPLGTVSWSSHGETNGEGMALDILSGYAVYQKKSFSIWPYIGLTVQEVDVGGYTETAEAFSSMVFGKQEHQSVVGAIGLSAHYLCETGFGKVLLSSMMGYESEFNDEPWEITAGMASLPGSSFRLSGYEPPREAIKMNLGVHWGFAKGWESGLSFGYRHWDEGDALGIGFSIMKLLE